MKRIFTLWVIISLLFLMLVGCNSNTDSGDNLSQNNGAVTTTAPLPSKESITCQQFKDKLDDVAEYIFTTEINTKKEDLTLFPYEGLLSCCLTSESNVNVATFMEFDTVENADLIINDTKANNVSGYDEETGKNFVKLTQDNVVVERVDKTVLITSTDNKDITSAIIKAINY